MALGSIAGSIAGGLASGAAGAGINALFGGGGDGDPRPISDFLPNFDTPALQQRFFQDLSIGEGFIPRFSLSDAQQAALGRFGSLSNTAGDAFAALRAQLAPGFGALTESRVQAVNNARDRALGTLRENLGRRRVLGSSFAGDALSRAEAEFGVAEADVRARSVLEEIDSTARLLNTETQTRLAAVSEELNQNLAASQISATLLSGVNASLAANANLNAQLAAQSASGAGAFFQPIIGGIGSAVQQGVSNFFGGGGSNLAPANLGSDFTTSLGIPGFA